jgi:hypothetical protein
VERAGERTVANGAFGGRVQRLVLLLVGSLRLPRWIYERLCFWFFASPFICSFRFLPPFAGRINKSVSFSSSFRFSLFSFPCRFKTAYSPTKQYSIERKRPF